MTKTKTIRPPRRTKSEYRMAIFGRIGHASPGPAHTSIKTLSYYMGTIKGNGGSS